VGSLAFANACSSTTTTTATVTPPPVTITTTNKTYTDPEDGTTYSSLADLKAHFAAVHPHGDTMIVSFTVNGTLQSFHVKPYWSLARVLREGLGMFSVKEGCQYGECGSCTVIVNGQAIFSCITLACELDGATVQTVEGMSAAGTLGKVQQKFYDTDAFQCGFCTPGFLMAAQALVNKIPAPTMAQVQLALSGHVCMCGNLHRTINGLVGGV
jgi:aerobic-type carbon monoxide dehydrogenase small subunit (CoxS/CutS family)